MDQIRGGEDGGIFSPYVKFGHLLQTLIIGTYTVHMDLHVFSFLILPNLHFVLQNPDTFSSLNIPQSVLK